MTVIATGSTFAVKEDLKSWGFRWDKARAAWTLINARAPEVNLFRHNVSSGAWEGVNLEVQGETF